MKKIRLQNEIYKMTNQPCSITICTLNRIRVFENREFTECCIKLLEDLCESCEIKLFAYCFMPDHVHFVIMVQGKKSIIDLVTAFKSISTKESWKYGHKDKIYQRRFYDHFIRKEEGLNQMVLYVLNNPVRKNIVNDWNEYPYSKCFL